MTGDTFGQRVLDFYSSLVAPTVPAGIEVMNPHSLPEVKKYVKKFCEKFYRDNNKRILVFGINPGRFGAGLTGINFTDPVVLGKICGIPNNLPQKRELSADFVYRFISLWGGTTKFYRQFFLTAVCPLGFVKSGVNYNFYDDLKLLQAVNMFIAETVKKQIAIGCKTTAVIILGSGKNKKFFETLNEKHKFFKQVYVLDHPRFVMQYRRKQIPQYLKIYQETFHQALGY